MIEVRGVNLKDLVWEIRRAWRLQASILSTKLIGFHGVILLGIENLLGLLSWFYLNRAIPTVYLERYDTDFLSYILLGLFFNQVVSSGLFAVSMAFRVALYDPKFKRLIMSRTNPILLAIISDCVFNRLLHTALFSSIQGVITFVIFKPKVNYSLLPSSLLILIFALLVNIAYTTLIDAPALYYPTLRVVGNPISKSLMLLSQIVAGIYYPVEVLPDWLQALSYVFPDSAAIIASRLFLSGDIAYMKYLAALIAQAAVYVPLSWICIKRIVRKVQREGFVKMPLF